MTKDEIVETRIEAEYHFQTAPRRFAYSPELGLIITFILKTLLLILKHLESQAGGSRE